MKKINFNGMNNIPFVSARKLSGAVRAILLLFLGSAIFVTSCKKDSEKLNDEAGGNIKNAAGVSAPSGNPTVSVYPVRGLHNHGWNSGLTSTGPYTCGNQYSNEDFIAGDHYGNDIFGALNTPIVSPVAGVLVTVVNTTDNGLGRHVYIKQANGWHHVLGHMNSLVSGLAVGQNVMPGQPIGFMGSTGTNSGGAVHLHYSINHGPGYWSTGIDPFPYTFPVENNVCTSVKSFNPTMDASVENGANANVNYGADALLKVRDGSTIKQNTYFKFDVTSVTTVGSAKLRIMGRSDPAGINNTIQVYGVDNDSWLGSTITWNNAPANNGVVLSSATVNALKYWEFDVTAYVQAQAAGDNIVSLSLQQLAGANVPTLWNSVNFASNKPELIITY